MLSDLSLSREVEVVPAIFADGKSQDLGDVQNSDPESKFNPFAPPEALGQMPSFDTGAVDDSSLVQRVKKGTGNELVGSALIAEVFAYLMPFGFVLDFLAAFLLLRVILSGSQPSPVYKVVAIFLSLWVGLRVLFWLMAFASSIPMSFLL